MKIGCHVSIAGGVANAPSRARELGCETFQIFTRSPQGGKASPITTETIKNFQTEMAKNDFTDFVVHAPYFVNFGSTKKNIFYGSVSIIKDELERCSLLGAKFLMTHLGTFRDIGEEKGMEQVVKGLLKVLEGYNGSTEFLLEISAGAGAVIGDTFDEMGEFTRVLKKYKGFGGICFDTQHAFSSGYDISTKTGIKKVFKEFDTEIGMEYMRMVHANDSKVELGGQRDRHEHIGEGLIGEDGFLEIIRFLGGHEKKMKTEQLLILETEHDKVRADIAKLKQLRSKLK